MTLYHNNLCYYYSWRHGLEKQTLALLIAGRVFNKGKSMEHNPFDINPYIDLDIRYQHLEKLRKDVDAQTYQFMDDFHKVFIPDQKEFDSLKDQAKQLQLQKASPEAIDPVYYKMAMIYQRWLPIEERLLIQNPEYKKLFYALKFLLADIEKRKEKEPKKKKSKSQPLDLNNHH